MHIVKSDTTNQIFGALAKAQSQIAVASKSSVNPAFRSRYADLSSVLAAVLPAWNANGLSLTQLPFVSDGAEFVALVTIIGHESGEFFQSEMRMPVGGKRDAHAAGAAITYARRFSVASIAGLMQDDDDGNLASAVTASREAAQAQVQSRPAAAPAPVQAPASATAPAPAPAPEPQPTLTLDQRIRQASGNELGLELLSLWAAAHDKGDPAEWHDSKMMQCMKWLGNGGWQVIRKWQAELDLQQRRRAEVDAEVQAAIEERVDAERVEAEIQESEEAQATAEPAAKARRTRRTKEQMAAYRASLAAGGKADGGEE